MSLPPITFGGLATGLDTNAMIDALVKVEHRPIDLLQRQQNDLSNKLSLFNQLSSLLGSLRSAAESLSTSAGFFVNQATSSDESVLTATAGSNASTGSHSIIVGSLAYATTQASGTFASTSDLIRQGTLAITVGSTTTNITVDGTNNTLAGLKDAINASGAAVNASIVQVGANSYRLVVNGKTTGAANAVTIDESGLTTGTDALPGFTVTQPAGDASLTVDGIAVSRSTNVVSDVIAGVTLNLKNTSAGPVQVTISNDTDAIKKQIKDFVSAYNSVQSFIHDQTKYDSDNKVAGALIGDSTVQTAQRLLRTAIGGTVSGTFVTLRDIGVTIQEDDTLSVNDTTLDAALAKDAGGVSQVFLDATSGVSTSVMSAVDNLTSTSTGLLTAKINGTQSSIDDLSESMATKETSLENFQQELTRKFAALEALVSQLKSQGQYLTQQLASLPRIS
ncbi:MAG TPA: flagellar filament capping protein FliD [Verrucomicrobiae bacterium]|jgi:flagellar hook-associated protein 2|nr:flagellar filament capping protein FliD [Verrucomicrobiae bacterium]